MAVTQSSLVDNIKAKHANFTDSNAAKDSGKLSGGAEKVILGTVEVTGTDFDADGDVVVLCPLHIDDVVTSIQIANDDLDGGTDSIYNLGLYTDAAGTDAQDEDCYATLVTGLQAARGFTEERFEALAIETVTQAVWQQAGYASRAAALAATEAYNGHLFLALTQTATVSSPTTGTLSFKVEYTDGG